MSEEKELTNVTKEDEVLSSVVKSWNLKEPIDILMAERVVSMWRHIKSMENKVAEQGYVVGIFPNIQPHPLISKIKDENSALLAFYKTFQTKPGTPSHEDFAEWINGAEKKKKCK
jgi:hypothetical protein